MSKSRSRGLLFDTGVVISKALSVALSGALFRGSAVRHRYFRKVRWLLLKHLGAEQVVLPFRSTMKLCALTSDDVIASQVFLDGQFSYPDFAKALQYLHRVEPKNAAAVVFVDVGANIGTHSLYALESRLFQSVVSIEPEANNFQLLIQNLRINGFDTRYARNIGLSSRIDTGLLSLSRVNFGDHRLVKSPITIGSDPDSSAQSVSLSDFASLQESLSLPSNADFVFWIDTQGHEFEVCSGIGAEVLETSVVVLEFWPSLLKKNNTLQPLLELLGQSMSHFAVLQEIEGELLQMTDLRPFAERWLAERGAHEQFDVFCVGNRRKLRR